MKPVPIIGAGMGGLSAAIYLRRAGVEVIVLEAQSRVGGLAASFEVDGLRFDGGPYLLLDRPGLGWAVEALGIDLDRAELERVERVYSVDFGDGAPIEVQSDLDATAEGFERRFPGSGARYRRFVARASDVHRATLPLLFEGRPSPWSLLRHGALRHGPFLLKSLGTILRASGLPEPIQSALGIWTHVAGQSIAQAPSPMAFVPALIHGPGCYLPKHGVGVLPELLLEEALKLGVTVATDTPVSRIMLEAGRVRGVRLEDGRELDSPIVLSNAHGVGTYLELVDGVPPRFGASLAALPLQSPGVAAYLSIEGPPPGPPYLRFFVPSRDQLCRLLITPAAVRAVAPTGAWPGRILMPLRHADVEGLDDDAQARLVEEMIAEPWWRAHVPDAKVVARRWPRTYGAEHRLHRHTMNPVMTAQFMRQGRLAHQSPVVPGLYLAGSATHPGQWVSFCAISGVLAARRILEAL